MKHEFLKFIVQPVLLEREDNGVIIGERVGEPTAVYSREQLIEFADEVLRQVGEIAAQSNGSGSIVKPEIMIPG